MNVDNLEEKMLDSAVLKQSSYVTFTFTDRKDVPHHWGHFSSFRFVQQERSVMDVMFRGYEQTSNEDT